MFIFTFTSQFLKITFLWMNPNKMILTENLKFDNFTNGFIKGNKVKFYVILKIINHLFKRFFHFRRYNMK